MRDKKSLKSFLITSFLAVVSLVSPAQKISFTIEGELKDIKDNATVWLGLVEPYELKGMAYEAKIKNGKFQINGTTFYPTIGTLSLFLQDSLGKALVLYPDAPKLQFYLFAGKNKIVITDSFVSISVKNSSQKEQNNFSRFLKDLDKLEDKGPNYSSLLFKASRTGDTTLYKQVLKKIARLDSLSKPLYMKFIKSNNYNYLSASLLHKSGRKFSAEETEILYNSLFPTIKNSLFGSEIIRNLDIQMNPAFKLVGQQMPDAELWDIKGNKVKLSSFSGKYILLDFWASWCSPCRKESPGLRKLYSQYGNSKFEIISVSIDINKSAWLSAIKEDSLTWPQLLDIIEEGKTGWNGKAITAYKGVSVPMKFLISPEGKIVEFNIKQKDLEKLLKGIYSQGISK